MTNAVTELTLNIEALLFSSGRTMSVHELARLCRATEHHVAHAIDAIKKKYACDDFSIMLVEEKQGWRLNVKSRFLPLVRRIVAETELSKTLLETLAIVAWRSPVLQAEVISIRTNKAYDHLRELEDAGFITRTKKGRTQLIKLTEKFFKYFELDKVQLRKHTEKITEAASVAEKLALRQRDVQLDVFTDNATSADDPSDADESEGEDAVEESDPAAANDLEKQ